MADIVYRLLTSCMRVQTLKARTNENTSLDSCTCKVYYRNRPLILSTKGLNFSMCYLHHNDNNARHVHARSCQLLRYPQSCGTSYRVSAPTTSRQSGCLRHPSITHVWGLRARNIFCLSARPPMYTAGCPRRFHHHKILDQSGLG